MVGDDFPETHRCMLSVGPITLKTARDEKADHTM